MNGASWPGGILDFCSDPAEFLSSAGERLAGDPVVSTVVATVAHRSLARRADGLAQREGDWWLVVRDGSGAVVGAGMRTASSWPYPPFLLPMPGEAAVALAQALHARGEEVLAVNGARPAVDLCAAELVRLGGGRVDVVHHTRLHVLEDLVPPAPVHGRLAVATEEDLELATSWVAAFMGDADRQAGREPGVSAHEVPDPPEMRRQLRTGRFWFWVDESGQRVHLTAANPPAFGVARLGPVYTPPSQRGRGWASNAVAEISARIRADGTRVCLFTDLANPTSNRIYAALGFRPVADMADLLITR